FHSPDGDSISAICGSSMVTAVTFSLCEKISGRSSTPILTDLACTNGARPYDGSSAIERSLAVTPPEKIASFRSPSFTSLPSAPVSSRSSAGRNVFASTIKDSVIAAATRTPAAIAADFTMRAISFESTRYPEREDEAVQEHSGAGFDPAAFGQRGRDLSDAGGRSGA